MSEIYFFELMEHSNLPKTVRLNVQIKILQVTPTWLCKSIEVIKHTHKSEV